MAALLDPAHLASRLVDLRHISASDLDGLLAEEIHTWEETLNWDFRKSADLVRRFVDLRALNGCALVQAREVVGYAYYVLEDQKGLIGDLYLLSQFRSAENENLLLESILGSLMDVPHVTRIESQLMMIDSGPERVMPYPRLSRAYFRNFMVLDLQRAALRPGKLRHKIYLERWGEHYQDAAAQLIASSYVGHVDSLINDQYRSVAGARRFLFNIVQYPGCGAFYSPASCVAIDRSASRLCGVSLGSLVAPAAGHITQICVAPWVRGTGVGYELLRQSLTAFRDAGCRSASLTVTASNAEAVRLYERVGFSTRRTFAAYVWEGF